MKASRNLLQTTTLFGRLTIVRRVYSKHVILSVKVSLIAFRFQNLLTSRKMTTLAQFLLNTTSRADTRSAHDIVPLTHIDFPSH